MTEPVLLTDDEKRALIFREGQRYLLGVHGDHTRFIAVVLRVEDRYISVKYESINGFDPDCVEVFSVSRARLRETIRKQLRPMGVARFASFARKRPALRLLK